MSSGKDGIFPHDLSPTRKLQTTATKGRLDGDVPIYNLCASEDTNDRMKRPSMGNIYKSKHPARN